MKRLLPYLLFALTAIVVLLIVLNRPTSAPTSNPTPTTTDAQPTQTNSPSTPDSTSHYRPYTASDFQESSNMRRVLFFYANWCPTCQPVNRDLDATSDLPADVVVYRVNYNDDETDQVEKDLAAKYAVTYQHTFVIVDREGNELDKYNGGSLEELLSRLN